MEIKRNPLSPESRKTKPAVNRNWESANFSGSYVYVTYQTDRGWENAESARIGPSVSIRGHVSSLRSGYFRGMKAYRGRDSASQGKIYLFGQGQFRRIMRL